MTTREPRRRGHYTDPHDPKHVLRWRLDGVPTSRTAPLVLALHGLGMTADLFTDVLDPLLDLDAVFLVPTAPLAAEKAGASWYAYDGNQERFAVELERVERQLLGLVAAVERECDLAPARRILLGFSQGGYCGAYVALRHPDLFAGMVISGARVKTEVLEAPMRQAAARGFHVFLCHGERDRAVSIEAAYRSRDTLIAAGVATALQTFDSGHRLDADQLGAVRAWIQRFLDQKL